MKFWFNTCRDFRSQPLDHTNFHKCVPPYIYMYIIYSHHFGIGLYIDQFVNNHIVKQNRLMSKSLHVLNFRYMHSHLCINMCNRNKHRLHNLIHRENYQYNRMDSLDSLDNLQDLQIYYVQLQDIHFDNY